MSDKNPPAGRMVDVSTKSVTLRSALATGFIALRKDTITKIEQGTLTKGDILATAQLAGVMAAKKTATLIPLCHPIPLTHIEVILTVHSDGIAARARTKTIDQTGVEMEALTAVAAACLTVYDMVKAHDRQAVIGPIKLQEKSGGKSGNYIRQ